MDSMHMEGLKHCLGVCEAEAEQLRESAGVTLEVAMHPEHTYTKFTLWLEAAESRQQHCLNCHS